MKNLLSCEEAAYYLGVSGGTLIQWRKKDKGPAYYVVGGRRFFYKASDLDAWIESQRVVPGEAQER